MDIQTKVIFTIETVKDNNVVKSSKKIIYIGQSKFIVKTIVNKNVKNTDEFPFEDGYMGDEVISFNEYNRVKVKFESNQSNSLLEIECYNSMDVITINPGDEILVSPGNCNQDEGLVPGYYTLLIRNFNSVYNGMYKIQPASMEWDNLLKIRSYLENIVVGLSYNIHLKRTGQLGIPENQNIFLSELYNYIESNFTKFINNINLVIKNPMTNIIKVYSEKNFCCKPDKKSQKWLSKKGVSLNNNPYRPVVNLEKHIKLTKNTIENKWVKKIINDVDKFLDDIQRDYNYIFDRLNFRIKEKSLKKEEEKNKYQVICRKSNIAAKNLKYDKWKKIKFLEHQLEELKKNLNALKNTMSNLKKMRALLTYYQYESWLKSIQNFNRIKKPSMCSFKDNRYSQIYNFYKNMNCISNKGNKNNTCFMHKKTALLYEYYIFVLVIKILKSAGYEWTKGWLADEMNLQFKNGDLSSETICKFEKDDEYCELVYDMEIEGDDVIKDDPSKSRFVNINANHCRPDIRIALYNKEGLFKRACIVEVKCRKKKYLIGKITTEVMKQLKDYKYGFGYYEAKLGLKEPIKSSIIDKVIVPYPKQDEKEINSDLYKFLFIQIGAADKNEKPYGYDRLEYEILDFLNKEE